MGTMIGLGSLSILNTLSFDGNQITAVPDLTSNVNLTSVYADFNNIANFNVDNLPSSIVKLSMMAVQTTNLANATSDRSNLMNLEALYIDNNNVGSLENSFIANAVNLRELTARD